MDLLINSNFDKSFLDNSSFKHIAESELRKLINTIPCYIEKKLWDELDDLIHAIKGVSGQSGNDDLFDYISSIEKSFYNSRDIDLIAPKLLNKFIQ